MKKIFTAFSNYNQKTNSIILEKVKTMSPDQIKNEIMVFYKTMADTLFHVISSDRKWLTRLSKYYKSSIIQEDLNVFMNNEKMNLNEVLDNIDVLISTRTKMDHDIIKIIEAIPEEDLYNEIEIPWGSGTIKKEFWKLLFQWFNHQTHHRGQMSIQLELVGIENDYSLVLDKIE
jgi:uncharacterized damage-inducible protein DinB